MDNDTDLADKLTTGHCPDCNHRGFVLGPRGGEAINIECGNVTCRSRFNVAPYAGRIMFAGRLPPEGEDGARWPSAPSQERLTQ